MSNNYLRHCSRNGKPTRITISLDEIIESKIIKLRNLMSDESGNTFSISKVINILVLAGILASSGMNIQDWHALRRFADGHGLDLEGISLEDYASNLSALRQTV